jgi:tetratricopeptide (TPR) repeat protein
MADEFSVSGRIGDRWRATGAERGPLGRPIGPEADAEGRGRRQTFEHGEICWSEHQKAIVTAYRLWKDAVFEWAIVEQYTYEYFRMDVAFDGRGQGQAHFAIHGRPDRGRRRIRLQGYGEYAFIVKGCDDNGSEQSLQGWTVPVRIQVGPEAPAGDAFPVNGVIAERWHELGAGAGALGHPVAEEEVGGGDYHIQRFERGTVAAYPEFGPHMTVQAYQHGRSVVIGWGFIEGAISEETIVEVFYPEGGSPLPVYTERVPLSAFATLECARESASSGQIRFWPALTGSYMVRVTDFVGRKFGVHFHVDLHDLHLEPYQRGGTPGRAFATLEARVNALVDYTTTSRTLIPGDTAWGEDLAMALIARFHALSRDGAHRTPGELPSHILVNEVLKDLEPGIVGTDATEFVGVWVCKTKGEYDTFLKGLIAIVNRYADLLTPEVYDHVTGELLTLSGGHDVGIETKEVCCDFETLPPPFSLLECLDPPESENHILLIESTRFLTNQLLFARTQDDRYDNQRNGLAGWLLGYLHTILKHDFHEFNARPYQRYSLNALINLHEFSSDDRVKTAARMVLDYTTVKFAVSSNRLRRIGPFRRLVSDVNSLERNDLVYNADPQFGFFLAYTGPVNPDGSGGEWIQFSWTIEALIAGLAPYRPPAAAYVHALTKTETVQHWLYHGERPAVRGFDGTPLLASPEPPAGGIEIYYSSPSFLLTAGGMFVNSGYGHDELMSFKNVGAVQSTTLLPTRADVKFEDVIRLDIYPDNRGATNYGVHRGFACGANLRGLGKWCELTHTPANEPWVFLNLAQDVPGYGKLGFWVAAYRTPVANPDSLVTVPENVGLFYAMEASPMGFEEFEKRTRERNTALPGALAMGDTYMFSSADDHSFTFRLWPAGVAYLPIVHHMDGQPIVEDFRALPLVDGPYLKAPHDHDGYIEIRTTGCDTPLVLDFRAPLNPVRQDNELLCPQPLLDRAQAYYGLAWELWNAGRHEDGLNAMRERVKIFDRLAVSDPGGFKAMLAQALVEETMFRTPDLPGAQHAGERAVTIYQELADIPATPTYGDLSGLTPNTYWTQLAGAFYFLAYAYWDDGKQTEGLRCLRNRVRLYERLAAADPATHRPTLAAVLVEETMFRTPDLPGAQHAGERAVTIYQELADIPATPTYGDLSGLTPNTYWTQLAGGFYFLAYAYWDDGKQTEGLRCLRNRVRLYERLATEDPAGYGDDLSTARQILPSFGG